MPVWKGLGVDGGVEKEGVIVALVSQEVKAEEMEYGGQEAKKGTM